MVFLTIDQAQAIDKFLTDAKLYLIYQKCDKSKSYNFDYYNEELKKCQKVHEELRKEIRKVVE